ncbi:unnamed protein product [Closterium sp. NIES-53]
MAPALSTTFSALPPFSALCCLPSVRRVASPSHFINAHLPSVAPSLVTSHLPPSSPPIFLPHRLPSSSMPAPNGRPEHHGAPADVDILSSGKASRLAGAAKSRAQVGADSTGGTGHVSSPHS